MNSRAIAVLGFALLVAWPAGSDEPVTGTFTLDSLSFVSFGGRENIPLPSGSTIRFKFGSPAANGSIPFTIDPSGVQIPEIVVGAGGETLEYSLAGPASGTMTASTDGRRIEFSASVRATLAGSDGAGSYTYAMPFTTESVSSQSLDGSASMARSGMRLVEGAWYAQMVGATVNNASAFPEPGSAVITVLSGSFDQVP